MRIALIGAGGYGANYASLFERLHGEGAAVFRAVADPGGPALEETKSRLAGLGVSWHADYRRMFEECAGDLDVVVIAAPIPLHLPMLEAALDRNVFVLLEKPPVPLIQDFLRVCQRPESAKVGVGFKLLADSNLWRLKEAMKNGAFGRIVSLRASGLWPRFDSYYRRATWAGRMIWREMPVFDGPATNALAHIVHNLMFLAGATPAGFGIPGEMRGEVYRARPVESYDLCGLTGTFPDGPSFSGVFTHAVERKTDWTLVVQGERGSATLTKEGVVSDVPLGEQLPGRDLFEECWADFHRFASGLQERPLTTLQDCHGYVAATNAMLVSSGGIRALPEQVVRRFEGAEDGGFDVEDIAGLAAESLRSGFSLTGCGAAWASDGRAVDAARLTAIPFEDFVSA
jgi:predicted dehydrogenase